MPAAADSADSAEKDKWAAVYDELRFNQSLSSVLNDPSRKGIFRSHWEGIEDLWEAIRETVEELGDQREQESQTTIDAAVKARTDELIGPVAEAPDIQPYMEGFTELWDVYYRNHRPRRSGRSRSPSKGAASSSASSKDVHVPTASDADDDASHAHESVPREYFRADFKLESHPIFRQSLQSSVERQEHFNSELTGYLDSIEVSLFEHIKKAQRDQLFDGLAKNSEPLQEDMRSALSVLAKLRGQLRSVQCKQLKNGLAVGRLARRQKRADEVIHRLETLVHVQQSVPSIHMLLQGQDYVTALELLESTTAAMESQLKGLSCIRQGSNRLAGLTNSFDRCVEADFVHTSTEAILDLRRDAEMSEPGVAEPQTALRGEERLRRLCWCLLRRELLKSALSSTLRDVLLSQLKKYLKSRARALLEELMAEERETGRSQAMFGQPEEPEPVSADGAEGAAPPAGPPAPPPPPPPEQDGATASTGGGDGGGHRRTPSAAEAGGGDAAGAGAPAQLKQQPQDVLATAGISAVLCALSFEGFLAFWRQIMSDCIDIAERFGQYAVLVDSMAQEGSAAGSGAVASTAPAAKLGLSNELLRLFEVIMNEWLKKIGVLLQARQAEHQSLNTQDWQKLLTFTYSTLDAVKAHQDSCRQRLNPQDPYVGSDVRAGVKAILYAQTKLIVEEFSSRCVVRIETSLDQERWERTDVPTQYKTLLERLLGTEQADHPGAPRDPTAAAAAEQGVERYLHVDGVHFLAVPAVLTLVQLLNEYVSLCKEFSPLAEIVVQRLTNLLRLFNQRMQQLVLGGQAVQRQIMKKITASNLALCSQCCGLVAQLLPALQERLQSIFRPDPEGQAASVPARKIVAALVADLSKVATEYGDHRNALFGKLSDLLRERYEFHAKKWLSSPHPEAKDDTALFKGGESLPPGDVDLIPHEALEGLVKDITNMYRVLLKNLTGDSVRKIFAKAFEDMAVKFEQRLSQDMPVKFEGQASPYADRVGRSLGDRLALDVAYLKEQLEKLSGISTPLQRMLLELVQHLQTKLPTGEPLKALHPAALEALIRSGRLPAPNIC